MKRNSMLGYERKGLRLLADTRGASLVEYIVLVGVVALIALAGYKILGKTVNNKIQEHGHKVNQVGH